MSWYTGFLRFIRGYYVNEDDPYERLNRKGETYQFSTQTLSTPFVKQANTYTTSNPHIQKSNDLLKLSENLTIAPVTTRETRSSTSVSTMLPQKLNAYTTSNPHIQKSNDSLKLSEKLTSSAVPTRETRSNTSVSTKLPQTLNSYTTSNPHIQKSNDFLKLSEKLTSSPVPTRETKSNTSVSTKLPQKLNSYTTSNPHIQKSNDFLKLSEKLTSSPVPTQETRSNTTISTTLPQKLHASCAIPKIVLNSATPYENSINNIYESATRISQHGSSSSPKPHRPSSKPTRMSTSPSSSTNTKGKTNYVFVQKPTLPTYAIPEDLKYLFERDIVPTVLKKSLTPSTYKEYFETLLYAEDFYFEKWDGFSMKNVTLELHEEAIYNRGGKFNVNEESDDKVFVAFKMDSAPERRPFLLSRDFVSVRPSGEKTASFQGVIYGVVKRNLVLVEFEKDFHRQHYLLCKYDVKFSLNRVCLKRAHQAILAASDPSFQNFLFPNNITKENTTSYPYIIEGPLSVEKTTRSSKTSRMVHEIELSKSGEVIRCHIINIYRMCPSCHILICAPTNNTCDVLTKSLQEEIPDIFRANAAFRELDGVPLDIIPNCRYKKECFSCPPLKELRKLKVVVSTYMSAFRLHNEGIAKGHFSHIFLVDASSTTEPEAMVALLNLADDETKVTVCGQSGNRSRWVRSDIARRHGLMVSFFERIRQSKLYQSRDPKFISRLGDLGK